MFVPETLASEEEPAVNTPVEVEMVKSAEELAVPPNWPNKSCESTQAVELGVASTPLPPVDVEYLLPCESKRFVILAVVIVAFVAVILAVSMPVETEILVEETFVRDEEPTENTPVDEEKVIRRDELAPPPRIPKRTWESTPDDRLKAVEVEYLLPLASTSEPCTWRNPLNVWLVPEAFAIDELPIENTPVEVEIVNSADDVAPPPSWPNRTWESTPDERAKAEGVEVEYLLPFTSKRFVMLAVVIVAFVTLNLPPSNPVEAEILVEETFVMRADAPRR